MYDFFAYPSKVGSHEAREAAVNLSRRYGFVRCRTIGKSALGTPIPSLEFGELREPAVIFAGVHGSEWATVAVSLRLAHELARAMSARCSMFGIDLCAALTARGLVIVPLLNPDGLDISRGTAIPKKSVKFSNAQLGRWQANGRGVDINHNFPSGFFDAAKRVRELGITAPGPTRYGGPLPLSESESRAAVRLCGMCRPRAVYALHSQGEEIYWRYRDFEPDGALRIAKILCDLTGYTLADPDAPAVGAGLKDWFIARYDRPGFTIELGQGKNPLSYSSLPAIYDRVVRALTVAAVI